MEVKAPIILIGTGRCGSTVFHETLTLHKNITYLDYRSMLAGYSFGFHRFIMGLQNLLIIGDVVRRRNYACEDYKLWNKLYRGFGSSFRDLEASDVTIKAKKNIRNFFSQMLTPSRPTLVLKITGWGRVGFLKEVFPDAKFIHIIRDGRGNANSLLEVDFWQGWRGTEFWGLGNLQEEDRKIWEDSKFSYVTLAGLSWKIINRKIENDLKEFSSDSKIIKYEEFCSNPIKVMKEVSDFACLPYTKHFDKNVRKKKISSKNYKWRDNLTAKQIEELIPAIHDLQKKYDYE